MMTIRSNPPSDIRSSSQRDKAIERTEKEITCIRALTAPEYQELLGDVRRTELRRMLSSLEVLKDKLKKNLFEVSIVGLEKSGKSTFANAYMGTDILPTKDARCTYTATSICYGTEDSAEVSLYSNQEFNEEFFAKLRPLGLNTEAYPADWKDWTKTTLHQAVNEKNENGGISADQENLLRDIEEILDNQASISALLDIGVKHIHGAELEYEIKDYIESPSKALAVKKIVIHSTKLSENTVIYDVPGFDSPTELHKAQTREWMKKSDAVILIVNCDKPSFNDSLVTFFKTIDKDQDGIAIGEKIFVFANRADQATSLEANLDKIRSELTRYHIVPNDLAGSRVIPGSAKAHLEAENGTSQLLMELLWQKGLKTDGIDEIRAMLNQYNNTDRMEVMYRRLQNVRRRLEEVLEEIRSENQVSDESTLEKDIQKQGRKLSKAAENNINKAISAYEDQVMMEYRESRPITKKMRESVEKLIDSGSFRITPEELKDAMIKSHSSAKTVVPAEYDVRENKYGYIYNAFIDCVVNLAVQEYHEVENALIEAFEKGCGISASNPYFEKLEAAVKKYIAEQCRNFAPEGYYSSLIRRYSGNLFYVLIRQPFTLESRFTSFDDERRNFYSLAMFGEESVLSIRPDAQPMHAKILYHELPFAEMESTENVAKLSKLVMLAEERLHDVIPARTELYHLLEQLASQKGDEAENTLRVVLSELRSEDIREGGLPLFAIVPNPLTEELINRLQSELSSSGSTSRSSAITTVEFYRNYFNDYKRDHNKDISPTSEQFPKIAAIIASEFQADVEILKDILNVEVMNAIDIEVPFVDLVGQNVRTLKESLGGDAFIDFMADNEQYILAAEYDRLREENEIRQKRTEVLRGIEAIMQAGQEEETPWQN